MPRKKYLLGNWKLNNSWEDTKNFVAQVSKEIKSCDDQVYGIAPVFTLLFPSGALLKDLPINLVAQNVFSESFGAFTGEVSCDHLKDCGVSICIVGHSERRKIFHESNELIEKKVRALVSSKMTAVLCVGESFTERQDGLLHEVLQEQIKSALKNITKGELKNICVAYEPVWAIGTGKVATPDEAQKAHAFIRSLLKDLYDQESANMVSILYGGSLNPGNCADICRNPDVDGGLVGGASLQADNFLSMVKVLQGLKS